MTALEDAQRAEAEAREDVNRAFAWHMRMYLSHEELVPPTAENTPQAIDTYAEAVRRTEALKAAEMLFILEIIEHHDYLMEHEFSSGLRARIRRVLKESHGV